MSDIVFIQVTPEQLEVIIEKAVQKALSGQSDHAGPSEPIKGIHELATFLRVSPARAQKLKNEKIVPCFQDGRLVLFDREKVRLAMEAHNNKKAKK
jgi:hypothetical protein